MWPTGEYAKPTMHMKEDEHRPHLMGSSAGPHRNEGELLEFAEQGNAAAFSEIYDRYVSLVYHYAYILLGNRNEAENLTAETFLHALQATEQYRGTERPVSSWLLIIARDLGLSQLRRTRRTKDAFRLPPTSTPGNPSEAESAHRLHVQELRQAIAALSPLEREVIILRFVLGLDYPQVAQVVGKSVNSVRVIQYRALRRLHKKLASGGHPDTPAGSTGVRSRR
jgi:RNA polymerase sigma-70 factor (ECF subfamily)